MQFDVIQRLALRQIATLEEMFAKGRKAQFHHRNDSAFSLLYQVKRAIVRHSQH